MNVYKAKSVYKAPGIYRSGIYKDPSEVVLLNGVRYENRFYEIDSNNVGSTFVDAVRLPEGYEKLRRVWYNGPIGDSAGSLMKTDYKLPLQFGDIYIGYNIIQLSTLKMRIFNTSLPSSNKRANCISKNNSSRIFDIKIWNDTDTVVEIINSAQFSDENKVKDSLLNGTWHTLAAQTGSIPTDTQRTLFLLTSRAKIDWRFFFVAGRDRQVTFTAIPCKHGSDYGLYDVVAGKFYTHPDLTGD